MKQAIMFPGLGADYPEMVATFCLHHPEATNAIELTIEQGLQLATAYGLRDVQARRFLHTQLSIHALNLAWFTLQKNHLVPQAACGHSLGFYAAAVTANAISPVDALKILVAAFTNAWHEFSDNDKTDNSKKVAVVTGFIPLLETPLTSYAIEVLSVNNPTQWLLYGTRAEFDSYLEHAGDQIMRIDYFATALPFHSAAMNDICKAMEQEFSAMEFCDPHWPLLSHIGKTELITTAEQVRWHLLNQLRMPIDWPQLVAQLKALELDPILEVGPNRILTQMIRWVDKRINAKCVDIYRVKETTHAVVNSSSNTTAKVALA